MIILFRGELKCSFDGRLHPWSDRLSCVLDQRKPGLAIMAVQNEGSGFSPFSVNQQDNHLAVALIRPMMRTGTATQIQRRGEAQVKGLHHAQTCAPQLLLEPGEHFIIGTIKREGRAECVQAEPLMTTFPSF